MSDVIVGSPGPATVLVGGVIGGPAGPTGPTGNTGATGNTGPTGDTGANVIWIAGAGAPAGGTGANGDMYLRTGNADVYGPKAGGAWGSPIANLVGLTGATGTNAIWLAGAGAPAGGTGVDGDMYLRTSNGDVYGPKAAGAWGSPICNITGPTGNTGSTGANVIWIAGAGVPAGGTGANGDMYLNNSNGDVYGPKAAGVWGGAICNITGPGNVGKQTLWIPASAMTMRATNGAATGLSESTTNKVMTPSLDFDQTTQEFVQFTVAMPKSWNEGTITAEFYWSAAAGSGDVVWGLQAVALSNDDALDTAFGTAQEATDTLLATGDVHVSPEISAMTIGGTPAVGDITFFQVYRDPADGGDTLTGDARLLGVKIYYTTDAVNDA